MSNLATTPSASLSPNQAFSALQWKKDFLKRPEGRIGFVGGALLLLAMITGGLYFIMPILVSIAWNIFSFLVALILSVALVGGVWAIAPIAWKAWQMFCRGLHRALIRIAPLDHVYAYREWVGMDYDRAQEGTGRISGVVETTQGIRDAQEKEGRKIQGQLQVAETQEDRESLNQQALDVADYLGDLDKRLGKLRDVEARAKKMVRSKKSRIGVLDRRIRIAEEKFETAESLQMAMSGLRQDVSGNASMSDGEVALRFVDGNYDQTIGSFQALESEWSDIFAEDRLNALVANEEGLARLNAVLDGATSEDDEHAPVGLLAEGASGASVGSQTDSRYGALFGGSKKKRG